MKRSKQRTHGGTRSGDDVAPIFARPVEKEKTWKDDVAAQADDAFAPYSLKSRFAKGALILHPKFGKGIVIAAESTTVTVLFEDGPKKLGHSAT